MNLVADTSIIIAVIADEPEKHALITQTHGAELFAPRSLHWEISNAFSAMLKRGRITLEQAQAAVKVYEQISLEFDRHRLDASIGTLQSPKYLRL